MQVIEILVEESNVQPVNSPVTVCSHSCCAVLGRWIRHAILQELSTALQSAWREHHCITLCAVQDGSARTTAMALHRCCSVVSTTRLRAQPSAARLADAPDTLLAHDCGRPVRHVRR